MATRGYICIKVADKDKNKFRKGNVALLHSTPDGFGEKGFKNNIRRMKINGNYLLIYHHWDSYPDGLGAELLQNYNDYEKVLNLCLCGNMSTIIDEPIPYAANMKEGLGCRDWKDEMPCVFDKVPNIQKSWPQYCYIYEQDKNGCYRWYVTESSYGRKKLLQ